jgi:predicted HD superfamily hydrolase involved in NAD metabolism
MDAAELRDRMTDLPEKLQQHIDRVVHEARWLAHLHHADEAAVALAAQAHDVVRHYGGASLIRLAEVFGLPVDPVDRSKPVLLHGPVGAAILPLQYGLEDAEALVTTRYHTTGRPGMGLVERIVFVADKVEPKKVEKRPELAEVRQLGETDLEAAIVRYLTLEMQKAAEKEWPLDPRAVATRNWLLLRAGRSGKGATGG